MPAAGDRGRGSAVRVAGRVCEPRCAAIAARSGRHRADRRGRNEKSPRVRGGVSDRPASGARTGHARRLGGRLMSGAVAGSWVARRWHGSAGPWARAPAPDPNRHGLPRTATARKCCGPQDARTARSGWPIHAVTARARRPLAIQQGSPPALRRRFRGKRPGDAPSTRCPQALARAGPVAGAARTLARFVVSAGRAAGCAAASQGQGWDGVTETARAAGPAWLAFSATALLPVPPRARIPPERGRPERGRPPGSPARADPAGDARLRRRFRLVLPRARSLR